MRKYVKFGFLALFLLMFGLFISRYLQEDRLEDQVTLAKEAYKKTYQAAPQTVVREEASLAIQEEGPSYQLEIRENPARGLMDEIEDYVGWIEIEGTAIDYPVVKTTDNDFYLNHDYNKQANVAGAIFMDRRNLGSGLDQHTIIYGHYMKNGTMFASLANYQEKDYLARHPYISLTHLYGQERYRIVKVQVVSADEYILPLQVSELGLDLDNQKVLTLSTCNYDLPNGRILLHAVLDEKTAP